MKIVKKIIVTFIIILSNYINGQGCSDAGFCTINSFKPNNLDSLNSTNNQFKIGAFAGSADNSIFVYGNYIEYSKQINKKFGIETKLTTLAQHGNGLSFYGFSDIFVNTNYRLNDRIKFTIGAKAPLSKANNSFESLPLPMDYQASLGTFDLIFGIGYELKKIQFVVAIQQPLAQNKNQFISTLYPFDSKLKTFQSTNKFERAGDILFRISSPINLNSKLKLTPSILPIYHINNDKFTDEFNVKKEINGSKGLTLNVNAYLDFEINKNSALQLNVGAPLVTRNTRPEGLTRSFITNLEYKIKF